LPLAFALARRCNALQKRLKEVCSDFWQGSLAASSIIWEFVIRSIDFLCRSRSSLDHENRYLVEFMSFDFPATPTDPIADLPTEKLERAMVLRNGLVALCEGGGKMNNAVYRLLRREFMSDPSTCELVPLFVRTTQDTSSMWAYLKDYADQWEPRRKFVRSQFVELIDKLEFGPSLSDEVISDTLITFDAEGVTAAWNKALSRRENDPSGAITTARTLLETVCKHILEDDDGNPTYGPNDDLPKLYKQTSELLNLAPSQHSENAFKRILGGASSVVEGLGTLRNKVGDAHSTGRKQIKTAPRHAALAVNMAGSMALFLIETSNVRSSNV